MDPEQVAAPVPDGGANPLPAQEPRPIAADPQAADPEEQALYEKFVAKAWMLVYDKQFFPQVVDMLEGEGDPVEGLARTTAVVVSRIMQLAQEAGQDLDGDVLFHGAKEVFEDLAELSRRAGIKDFSQDEDALEASYFRALDHFRMTLEGSGGINREAAQEDLAKLQAMDEAGELEGFFQRLAAEDDGPSDAPEAEAAPPQRGGLMPKGMN